MKTSVEKSEQVCALCGLDAQYNALREGELRFCCPGCHAVYQILSAKSELGSFEDTPVFQEAFKAGLISNPALLQQIRDKQIAVPSDELEKLYLEVEEMWCPTCAELIRLLLLQKKGVRNCIVDYATDLASIEFAPRYISKEQIISLIRSCGYQPRPLSSDEKKVSFSLYLRFFVAAFFSINTMMFSYPLYATYFDYDTQGYGNLFAWISGLASLPVVTYCAWPIFRRFVNSLRLGILGMETLVVIAVVSAFGLSLYELQSGGNHVYFDSMSVIITFILLGKIIETKAKFSAKNSLLRLTRSMPRRGRKRFLDGKEEFTLVKEIRKEDVLVAYHGEKIVLDGIIIEGEASCDESVMTGESIPIPKTTGSTVLSGTVVKQGWVAYRVTATENESALHRIIEMVERDIQNKTVYVRAADQIVRWFVPVVLMIAFFAGFITWIMGGDGGESFLRSISVLLISCPCAIGIAAPLAESHTLNGMAKLGAIIRNRGCLSVFGKETTFVFDKTGTVTEGTFRVLKGLDSLSKEHLAILKDLASRSTHPISSALAESILEDPLRLDSVEEFPGNGMKGQLQNQVYFLGSESWIRSLGWEVSSESKETTVYFVANGVPLEIQLGDQVRSEVKTVLEKLKPAKSLLLSGDHERIVASVAQECGFHDWKAECHPLEKKEMIDQLKENGELVSMIGDGINDAPALTTADVGISVVSATDITIQVSDILLTTDRLEVLPKLRTLAIKGQRIVKQNLFWAFFYNGIGVGFAAFGKLSPLFAALAMVTSSLMVLFNAKRIDKTLVS